MDALVAYDGLLLRVGLYLLVFWPTVGHYVYRDRDAEGRGRPSPGLTGLVYGSLGLLGLALSLPRRDRRESMDR